MYKRLPPHTNEAHPHTNAGEASKPLVIAIITIVAVVALSLLLLFSEQLAGRAFFVGAKNSAGVVPVTAYENQPFSLKAQANTDRETSTLGFILKLPQGVTCNNVLEIKNSLGWELESKKICDANKNLIVFEYATFQIGKSGTFDVAEISFSGLPKGSYAFVFESFQAFDNKNMNVIQTVENPTVEVKIKEQVQQLSVCGNGKVEGKEECDLGNNNGVVGSTCFNCLTWLSCARDLNNLNNVIMQTSAGPITFKANCFSENLVEAKICLSNPVSYTTSNIKCADGEVCIKNKLDNGASCVPPLPQEQLICGNGKKEGPEACDDGNKLGGDGCSALCQLEQQPPPPPPQPVCGDGKKEGTETCDDGNKLGGDGCSALCQLEQQLPPPPPQPVCGNNIKEGTEACDDGNKLGGDGCSALCQLEQQPPPPPPQPVCGNGKLEGTEQCDDGNKLDGDGCSSLCAKEVPATEQVMTVTGTKIILTDVATANNVFSTKVTATESFTNEITIYTVLYGANNKVLSIKSEKVEGGMQKDVTYAATVNYPQANVKSKSVLVFDDKKNPFVYGQLQKPYG